MKISHLIPNPDDLLALEPEELAGYLLKCLAPRKYGVSGFRSLAEDYPDKQQECQNAMAEAWVQLLVQGLVAPDPGNRGDIYFLTRRGRERLAKQDYADFQRARLFPRKSLHPAIESTYPLFLRGDYETAVFQAFKGVEVAVRDAGGYATTELGVALMRKAFHPGSGPLSLSEEEEHSSEQQALSDLFAGAIGRFKNPSSHRHVEITDPAECIEMLQFASHLLRIVDDRRGRKDGAEA